MDASERVVSSVLIRDGRFFEVGDTLTGAGSNVRKIDLGGRTVLPGLVDTHNHIVLMGLRPGYHTPLENAYSIVEVQETIAARRPDVPKGHAAEGARMRGQPQRLRLLQLGRRAALPQDSRQRHPRPRPAATGCRSRR
jgi:predicted amidohydrolase YtcJ